MPKRARELGPLEVKRLDRPGLHAVGAVSGLALQVTRSGARSWILRYRHNGRRREAGLGAYPDVSLAKAREYAREARDQLRKGIDPLDAAKKADRRQLSFSKAVDLFFVEKAVEFRSALHRKQWRASLERHAAPTIGDRPVSEIELDDILAVLRPIWTTKTETASKVRQRMERVIDYATVTGHRDTSNPARWRGNLDLVLPAPNRLTGGRNYPALKLADTATWFSGLTRRQGTSARALEFLALTAARTGAVRFMTWDEIDLNACIWTIHPGRQSSKIPPSGRPHRVPLSQQALGLLEEAPRLQDCSFVFPAARGGAMSDAALAAVMKKIHLSRCQSDGIGYVDAGSSMAAVPHGLRSTFRTWVGERTNYDGDMAEIALAHKVGSKVQQAYDRSDQLEKRRTMMSDWSDFLRSEPNLGSQVVRMALKS